MESFGLTKDVRSCREVLKFTYVAADLTLWRGIREACPGASRDAKVGVAYSRMRPDVEISVRRVTRHPPLSSSIVRCGGDEGGTRTD